MSSDPAARLQKPQLLPHCCQVLERAVAAARVVDSLKHAPSGALIAAHAVTAASDYLVWIDLQSGSLVAAFADARAYFAG